MVRSSLVGVLGWHSTSIIQQKGEAKARVQVLLGKEMSNYPYGALLRDVARDVVEQAAPHELPIYQAASAAFFADPKNALQRSRAKDSVLGFGFDPLTAMLTPAILSVLWGVFAFLVGITQKAIAAGLEREISDILKSMFAKFGSPERSLLTGKQVEALREQILRDAEELKIPGGKARALAETVIAQLAVPQR
jgi:hypothetical protein